MVETQGLTAKRAVSVSSGRVEYAWAKGERLGDVPKNIALLVGEDFGPAEKKREKKEPADVAQ